MNYFEIADFNPLSLDFKIPSEFVPIRRYKPEEVLSKIALIKFKTLNLDLREVQMFTTPPYKTTGIHIDGDEFISKSAINYVVNGPGIMKWYSFKDKKEASMITDAKTVYTSFSPHDCIETDQLVITKLTLIEVCQPHNIVNNTDSFRYCFSIRYHNSTFSLTKEKISKWNNLLN